MALSRKTSRPLRQAAPAILRRGTRAGRLPEARPMSSPSIGARGRRFVLELPIDTPDGFGGTRRSYAAGPELWGAMEFLSGDERVRGDRLEQAASHRVTLRWREGVTAAMRLTSGPRRFAIRSAADPDGRRRDLVCLVEEIGP